MRHRRWPPKVSTDCSWTPTLLLRCLLAHLRFTPPHPMLTALTLSCRSSLGKQQPGALAWHPRRDLRSGGNWGPPADCGGGEVVHCQQAGGACGEGPAQPLKMRAAGVLAAWGIERGSVNLEAWMHQCCLPPPSSFCYHVGAPPITKEEHCWPCQLALLTRQPPSQLTPPCRHMLCRRSRATRLLLAGCLPSSTMAPSTWAPLTWKTSRSRQRSSMSSRGQRRVCV